jgi:hypothetical protein
LLSVKPYRLLDEQATVNGVECFHVRADWRSGCADEIWISKAAFSIHKVASEFTSTKEEDEHTISTVRRLSPKNAGEIEKLLRERVRQTKRDEIIYNEIVFDEPIAPAIFNYIPPRPQPLPDR